jgi:hypothetical protein
MGQDKSTPREGDMVFDYEYGAMRLIGTTLSQADMWAGVPNPKTLALMARDGVQECASAPLASVVKLDMIDAWLDAHDAEDDPEPDGFGTARQQAYRYLSHNGFDGTCACCGVDFTEYML